MILADKVALVTGASRGIGRAIALELARAGADVVVNYAGNERAAGETAQKIEETGRKTRIIKANVEHPQEVQAMIKQVIDEWGRVDILVNNAGITRDNLLMRMKEDEWDSVINTNLKGVFNCIKAVSRQMMKQRSGRVINISSVVGSIGNAGQANYAAAKAGIFGLTKVSAREMAPRGITVNTVAPGFIDTEMTASLADQIKENILAQIPLGRLGEAAEIAQTVVFLASDAATYITGQTIHVDGGMYMN